MGESYFTTIIRDAIENKGYLGIIVYGAQGYGKSTYALQLTHRILGSWEKVLNSLCFTIDEVNSYLSQEERQKILIWDDAGVHANKYIYYDEREKVKTLSGLLDTIRTFLACLILTTPTPSKLLKPIRELPFYYAKIVQNKDIYRRAKIYKREYVPDKLYTKLVAEDYFTCRLPDWFYIKYDRIRDDYAREARRRYLEAEQQAKIRKLVIREKQGKRR